LGAHWTKVLCAVVGTGNKVILGYVIRRLNALSAGLKNRLKGLAFAETPLSAISRFNWSPESPEARPLLKAAREDGSSFRADLEQSTPNERRFMNFVSRTKSMAVPHQIHTYTELRQQIHDDLPIQHPEWVEPNGASLMCLMELLDSLTQRQIQRVYRYPSSRLRTGLNRLDSVAV